MSATNTDVAAAILEQSIDGSSKKALQHSTGLAFHLLDKHLVLLESKKLVRILRDENSKKESIKITQKGIKFLILYDAMYMKYILTATSK
jgi:predicted transcriptional regulator